jgi:hypothetical protein
MERQDQVKIVRDCLKVLEDAKSFDIGAIGENESLVGCGLFDPDGLAFVELSAYVEQALKRVGFDSLVFDDGGETMLVASYLPDWTVNTLVDFFFDHRLPLSESYSRELKLIELPPFQ